MTRRNIQHGRERPRPHTALWAGAGFLLAIAVALPFISIIFGRP